MLVPWHKATRKEKIMATRTMKLSTAQINQMQADLEAANKKIA
jgi:hypothetical protein